MATNDAEPDIICLTQSANAFGQKFNMSDLSTIAIGRQICGICTEEKISSAFYTLTTCQHSLCRECVTNWIVARMEARSVKTIQCPEPQCAQLVTRTDVVALIDRKTLKTFDYLLLKAEIISMDNVVTCPDTACQVPCYTSRSATAFPVGANIVQCPYCETKFCFLCKQLINSTAAENESHTCELSSPDIQAAIDAYENSATGNEERKRLETVYGRQILENWIGNRKSERLIETKKKCPQCRAPCDKEGGCNHVRCVKCETDWCWLCGQELVGDYFQHYRAGTGTACAGRLEPDVYRQGRRPLAVSSGDNQGIVGNDDFSSSEDESTQSSNATSPNYESDDDAMTDDEDADDAGSTDNADDAVGNADNLVDGNQDAGFGEDEAQLILGCGVHV